MKQTDSKSNIPLLIRNFYVHLINRPYEFTLKNNKVFISSRYILPRTQTHTHTYIQEGSHYQVCVWERVRKRSCFCCYCELVKSYNYVLFYGLAGQDIFVNAFDNKNLEERKKEHLYDIIVCVYRNKTKFELFLLSKH